MKSFAISSSIDANCVVSEASRAGELFHVRRNQHGGALLTPVGHFFAWRPEFIEGFNAYWRIDCFIKSQAPAVPADQTALDLVAALVREDLCAEPIWVSWHRSEELAGQAFGEVFEE